MNFRVCKASQDQQKGAHKCQKANQLLSSSPKLRQVLTSFLMTSTYYCLQKKSPRFQNLSELFFLLVFSRYSQVFKIWTVLPSLELTYIPYEAEAGTFESNDFPFFLQVGNMRHLFPIHWATPTFARDDSATSFISCCVLTADERNNMSPVGSDDF